MATKHDPTVLDSNRSIRVNAQEFERFQKACAEHHVDVSTVMRSLMSQVADQGLRFNGTTGVPFLKPTSR